MTQVEGKVYEQKRGQKSGHRRSGGNTPGRRSGRHFRATDADDSAAGSARAGEPSLRELFQYYQDDWVRPPAAWQRERRNWQRIRQDWAGTLRDFRQEYLEICATAPVPDNRLQQMGSGILTVSQAAFEQWQQTLPPGPDAAAWATQVKEGARGKWRLTRRFETWRVQVRPQPGDDWDDPVGDYRAQREADAAAGLPAPPEWTFVPAPTVVGALVPMVVPWIAPVVRGVAGAIQPGFEPVPVGSDPVADRDFFARPAHPAAMRERKPWTGAVPAAQPGPAGASAGPSPGHQGESAPNGAASDGWDTMTDQEAGITVEVEREDGSFGPQAGIVRVRREAGTAGTAAEGTVAAALTSWSHWIAAGGQTIDRFLQFPPGVAAAGDSRQEAADLADSAESGEEEAEAEKIEELVDIFSHFGGVADNYVKQETADPDQSGAKKVEVAKNVEEMIAGDSRTVKQVEELIAGDVRTVKPGFMGVSLENRAESQKNISQVVNAFAQKYRNLTLLDSPVLSLGRFMEETVLAPLRSNYSLNSQNFNLTSIITIRKKPSHVVQPIAVGTHDDYGKPYNVTLFAYLCREYLRNEPFQGFERSQLEFTFSSAWPVPLILALRKKNVEADYMKALEAYGERPGVRSLSVELLQKGITGALRAYTNTTTARHKPLAEKFLAETAAGGGIAPAGSAYSTDILGGVKSVSPGYAWMVNHLDWGFFARDRVVQDTLFLPASASSISGGASTIRFQAIGLRDLKGILITRNSTSRHFECHDIHLEYKDAGTVSVLPLILEKRINSTTPVAGETVLAINPYRYRSLAVPGRFPLAFFPVRNATGWAQALYDSRMTNLRLDADYWIKSDQELKTESRWAMAEAISSTLGLVMPFALLGMMGKVGAVLGHWVTGTVYSAATAVVPNLIQSMDADREDEASTFAVNGFIAMLWDPAAAGASPFIVAALKKTFAGITSSFRTMMRHINRMADGTDEALPDNWHIPWAEEEIDPGQRVLDQERTASLISGRLNLEPYRLNPEFRDIEAAINVGELLKGEGYEVRYGAMYLWKDANDIFPEVHYMVRGRPADGTPVVVDLTAMRFGADEPLIRPEDAWLDDLTDTPALKGKLASHKWYDRLDTAVHDYGRGRFVPVTLPGYPKTVQPQWFREANAKASVRHLQKTGELDQLMGAGPSVPHADVAPPPKPVLAATGKFERSMDLPARAELKLGAARSHVRERTPTGGYRDSNDFVAVANYRDGDADYLVTDREIRRTLNSYAEEYDRLLTLGARRTPQTSQAVATLTPEQSENFRLGAQLSRDMGSRYNEVAESQHLSSYYYVLLRKSENRSADGLLNPHRIYGVVAIKIMDDPLAPGTTIVLVQYAVMHPHVAAHRLGIDPSILQLEDRFAIKGGAPFLTLKSLASLNWSDYPGAKIQLDAINPFSARIAESLKMKRIQPVQSVVPNQAPPVRVQSPESSPGHSIRDPFADVVEGVNVLALSTWYPDLVRAQAGQWVIRIAASGQQSAQPPVADAASQPIFVGLDLRGIANTTESGKLDLTNFASTNPDWLSIYPLAQIDRAADDALASAQWKVGAEEARAANASLLGHTFSYGTSINRLKSYNASFLQPLAANVHVPIVLGIHPRIHTKGGGEDRTLIGRRIERTDIKVVIVPEGMKNDTRTLLYGLLGGWTVPVSDAPAPDRAGDTTPLDPVRLRQAIAADARCTQWRQMPRKDSRVIATGLAARLSGWGYRQPVVRQFRLIPRDGSEDIDYFIVVLRDGQTEIVVDLAFGKFSPGLPQTYIVSSLAEWQQTVSTALQRRAEEVLPTPAAGTA
ncbi:hypothetical protein [Paraburkholderia aspalathi]|uniref:hypothetical protein n=1 Tax=Paraburkholderia aspalathi TaxID=1324617 RepID=UPI0038B7A571